MEYSGKDIRFRYAGCMPYLVKAVFTSGVVTWVSEPGLDGVRCTRSVNRPKSSGALRKVVARSATCPMPSHAAGLGSRWWRPTKPGIRSVCGPLLPPKQCR